MSGLSDTLSPENKQFLLEHSKCCSILSNNVLNKYKQTFTCWRCGKALHVGDIVCRSSKLRRCDYLCKDCYQHRMIDIPDIPNRELCKELGLPEDYLKND